MQKKKQKKDSGIYWGVIILVSVFIFLVLAGIMILKDSSKEATAHSVSLGDPVPTIVIIVIIIVIIAIILFVILYFINDGAKWIN